MKNNDPGNTVFRTNLTYINLEYMIDEKFIDVNTYLFHSHKEYIK